jgi:archaellum biogenesis ATPase FlaH
MTEELSPHLQDCIVYLAITDTSFLRLIRPAVKPEFFGSPITEQLIKLCFNYWDQFGESPADHLHDELQRFLSGRPETEIQYYTKYVEKIRGAKPPSAPYIVSRLNDFIRIREWETAAVEFAKLVAGSRFVDAQELMFNALRAGISRETVGYDYLQERSWLLEREEAKVRGEGYMMPTGIPALDRIIGGYKRGQLVCVMGGYAVGKSWFCVHSARTGLMRGLNVLYVTHEMSREEVEERMDMACGALRSEASDEPLKLDFYNPDTDKVTQKTLNPRLVGDSAAVIQTRKAVARFGGRLIIRKYPMGTCSAVDLLAYVNWLESFERFIPDLILCDYPEIMKSVKSRDDVRHEINETYIQLKRLSDEKRAVVIAPSQVRRESLQRERLRMQDIAEEARKIGNADKVFGIGQTELQSQYGRARVQVLKNRGGKQNVGCEIGQCFEIGQFCLWSAYRSTTPEA